MSAIVLLPVITFIYFDVSVLKKQNTVLFLRIFSDLSLRICLWGMALICLILSGAIIAGIVRDPQPWDDYLSLFFMVFVFPLYLVKRYRFKEIFRREPSLLPCVDKNLSFASDAFGVVLLWFLGMTGIVLFIKGGRAVFPQLCSELAEVITVALFSFLLMLGLICRMMKRWPDLPFMEVMGLHRHNQPWGKLVVLPVVIGLILAYVSSMIIFFRTSQPVTPLSRMIESTTSVWVFAAFIGVAVLLAPFFEEIIFRGFFFYVIRKFRGKGFAICFIAILFGVMHFDQYWGDWAAIAMVMFLGFVLTFLRAWTGSSLPCIVTHYTYNGAMTIIPVLMFMLSNPGTVQTTYERAVGEIPKTSIIKSK